MLYLESLFGRALDAVVGMDTKGRVTAWNGAAEKIFGWSRKDAIGASMGDLIVPAQHQEAHARGLERYLQTGVGPVLESRIQITAIRRDGDEFPVEISIFPMSEPDQEPMFYAFIRSLEGEAALAMEQVLRAKEGEAMMKIGHKLIEDISLEEFTKFCLKEACDISGMDAAHLFLKRGKGASAALVASGVWHLRDRSMNPVIEETSRLQFGRGDGLPGRAWQSGRLEAINDLVNDCKFARRQVFLDVGLTCGVAIPIHLGGETYAVVEFFGTPKSRLDPPVLRLLQTVGSQIGAAYRRKEGVEQREMLRREMMHRVGNSLTVLSSIYRSCSRKAKTKDELDASFLTRVVAMGRANKMAIVEAEAGVELTALINNSLEMVSEHRHLKLEGSRIKVCSEAVLPLSLVLNELGTNAMKYGELGTERDLYIRAATSEATDELIIEWRELRAVPLGEPPMQPLSDGFGSELKRAMIEGRLGGSYERRLDETGFHFIMKLPRSRVENSETHS